METVLEIHEAIFADPMLAVFGAVTMMQAPIIIGKFVPAELTVVMIVLWIARLPWLMHKRHISQLLMPWEKPGIILHHHATTFQ